MKDWSPAILNDPHGQNSIRFLLPAAFAICGVILLFRGFDPLDLRRILDCESRSAPWLFIGFGVAAMTVMVPKTMISMSAGAIFGLQTGGALMLAIAVLAAALNYQIGQWWLYESINRRLGEHGCEPAKPSPAKAWARAIRALAANGNVGFHLLVRLTPMPTTLISYTMGASGSRIVPFLVAAAIAVIPQLLWVYCGTAVTLFEEPTAHQPRWSTILVAVGAAIATGSIVPRLALKHLTSHRQP